MYIPIWGLVLLGLFILCIPHGFECVLGLIGLILIIALVLDILAAMLVVAACVWGWIQGNPVDVQAVGSVLGVILGAGLVIFVAFALVSVQWTAIEAEKREKENTKQ